MSDARIRLRYLRDTVRLLYPGPGAPRAYSVLPHPVVPRRLAPRRWWHPSPVVTLAVEGSIEAYLSEVFGVPVECVLRVRPARRANRKPVLEAYSDGELLAFVKIGDTERAGALVANEAATLSRLADVPLETVVPPVVLHHGVWRELSVLALSPLPIRRGRVSAELLTRAVKEIAATGGPASAASSPPADDRARGTASDAPGDTVGDAMGDAPGDTVGTAWHGDLSPWNIAPSGDGRLLVWDWERYQVGVPYGFDAVHHFFQRALRRMDPSTAARACLAQAVSVLAPLGLSAAQARLTTLRYLIALADRHAADGWEPLGPPDTWLNPLVDHQELLA
ncbi:hypothetical protein ABZ297_35335 [Nonomuraea sp. NPDC005983]|uniref:hypothetical protein n=1 Tax=Nonomuraea sp. NPDC005983 TaxID=3155595 RepID=UPI0033A8333D